MDLKDKFFISGFYENDFKLPLLWKEQGIWNDKNSYDFYQNYSKIFRTNDGIIYLSEFGLKRTPLKLKEKITLSFGRIDLLAWKPIKEKKS